MTRPDSAAVKCGGGDPDPVRLTKGADDTLFEEVYSTLRDMAAQMLRIERRSHTLQPTALVHEAYVELREHGKDLARSKPYFFAAAARAMRQILVAHARRRSADKRGVGWRRIPLNLVASGTAQVDLLSLEEAMTRLATTHGRSARAAELRLFAGLSTGEIATILGVSRRTVDFDWRFARAALLKDLGYADG
ncbi:MAG: ECF-type sigma factor [Phycisphaerales bacterium]|nr:ECF-type sigma factor [Phycisphaerales bacterium]